MSRHRLFAPASLLLPVALLFGACGKAERTEKVSELSQGCLVNSDCADPLVCVFQRCHVECETTRDCDGILRCVGAKEAVRACQLEDESHCQTNADCATSFVCGSDGACRDACASSSECIGEQVCTAGTCAEPFELDESGKLPQTLTQASCRLNSDCPEGEQCISGACVAQCRDDRDCPATSRCQDGACRPTGAGCVGDDCACACREDVDCAAEQVCDGCGCRAAPLPECQTSLDCAEGGRCVDGACACACQADRDCPSGSSCDGCACQADEVARVIHDATLQDSNDIALMSGITAVETRLTLGPGVTTTIGLEALVSVGSLYFEYTYELKPSADGPSPLIGFANLRSIEHELSITNSALTELDFDPALQIKGDVVITGTSVPCDKIGIFEANLRKNGFDQSFSATSNEGCTGQCVGGVCQ